MSGEPGAEDSPVLRAAILAAASALAVGAFVAELVQYVMDRRRR